MTLNALVGRFGALAAPRLFLAAIAVSAFRADAGLVQDAQAALSSERLSAHLRTIAHDSMHGRGTGSPGQRAAFRYVQRTISAIADGGPRIRMAPQDVPMATVWLAPEGVAFTSENGNPHFDPAVLLRGFDFEPLPGLRGLAFPRNASTLGGIVPGGRLGSANRIERDSARGRIVVLDAPIDVDGREHFRIWEYPDHLRELASARAVAVATLDLTPRSLIEELATPRIEPRSVEGRGIPPVIAISRSAANLLLEAENPPQIWRAAGPGEAFRTARVRFSTRSRSLEAPTENLVATVEGGDRALRDEVVLISAKLDHLGFARPDERVGGDSVMNGANEGGSGAAALLGLIEYIAKSPTVPRRSVAFLWTVGDEQGLIGSTRFVEQPTLALSRVVAHINLDMLASPPTGPDGSDSRAVLSFGGSLLQTPALRRHLDAVVQRTADSLRAREQVVATAACQGNRGIFSRRGVPSLEITTGEFSQYHTVKDDIEHANLETFVSAVRVVAALVEALAADPAPLQQRGSDALPDC